MDGLLKEVEQTDSITAQLLLQEAYEQSYGIYNHDAADAHPWALALNSDKEDYTPFSPLYNLFYRYRVRDIYKRWGLSITELLEMPREFVELVFDISKEEDIKDQKLYKQVKDSVDGQEEKKPQR